mmetsp:Transcript_28548/g.45875  ORF Transcript_28548/g.45875 Transcript_28548/m.45875 type:complete len:256 (+) Transcript_28548:338-1105(+)
MGRVAVRAALRALRCGEDQLGEPLAICLNESGAPRTLVCFHPWGDTRQGPRVNVRTDTSQIWSKGRLVRPFLPESTGRGALFWVQLDRAPASAVEADMLQVLVPSCFVEVVETFEHLDKGQESNSADGSGSDCEVEVAALCPTTTAHLHPLLLLLQLFFQSGAHEPTATSWFMVLLRVIIFIGTQDRAKTRCAVVVHSLVDASFSSVATAGSTSEAAAACMEALIESIPADKWPQLRAQLCAIVCTCIAEDTGSH